MMRVSRSGSQNGVKMEGILRAATGRIKAEREQASEGRIACPGRHESSCCAAVCRRNALYRLDVDTENAEEGVQ